MIEATQIKEEEINDLVDWLEAHPIMSTSQLVSFTNSTNRAVICLEGDYDDGTKPVLNALLGNSCFPTIPAAIADGWEHWDVLTPTNEQASQAYKDLQQLGTVQIDSLRSPEFQGTLTGLLKIKKAVQNLTSRQIEVLLLALEEGYYDSPRSCKLEDLSELDTTGISTVGEHLRLSESKILKAIEPMLDHPNKNI